jgi:hypothetical protein
MAKTVVDSLREDPSRVNRLPVWAQDLVWTLCQEIESRDKLQEAKAPDGSNTWVVTYGIGGPDRPLGKSPVIGFQAPHVCDIHAQVRPDGSVEVSAIGGYLAILPTSGNTVVLQRSKAH